MSRASAAVVGLVTVAWALAVPILGGALRPGYSHASQFISELGESGAQGGSWMSLLRFAPIGAGVLAFLALAAPYLPASRRRTVALVSLGAVGTAYLVASVARCEPGCPSAGSASQSLHNLFGLFEYVGALAGFALLFGVCRGSERWRPLAPACAAAALLVALGLLGMLDPDLAQLRGVSQRIAELGIFGWIALVSLSLARGH